MTPPLPNRALKAGWPQPHWVTPERLESITVQGKECDAVLTNVMREDSVGDAENCIFTFKRQNGKELFFFRLLLLYLELIRHSCRSEREPAGC